MTSEEERQLRMDGCIHEYQNRHSFEICIKCSRSRNYLEGLPVSQVERKIDRNESY